MRTMQTRAYSLHTHGGMPAAGVDFSGCGAIFFCGAGLVAGCFSSNSQKSCKNTKRNLGRGIYIISSSSPWMVAAHWSQGHPHMLCPPFRPPYPFLVCIRRSPFLTIWSIILITHFLLANLARFIPLLISFSLSLSVTHLIRYSSDQRDRKAAGECGGVSLSPISPLSLLSSSSLSSTFSSFPASPSSSILVVLLS